MFYTCCIPAQMGSSNIQSLKVGYNQEEKNIGLLFVLLAHKLISG